MGVAVAVVPGLLVAVAPARRNEAIEQIGQVLLEPRLEFDGGHGGRAADAEDMRDAGADAGAADERAHLLGEVVHVAVSLRRQLKLLLEDHNLSFPLTMEGWRYLSPIQVVSGPRRRARQSNGS